MPEGLRERCAAISREESVLREGGGKAGQDRQHKMGRLFARERISRLLDPNAPFFEVGLWAAYQAQVPRAYLAFGFTSVVDLDLTQSSKAWFESTPLHPHLYSCGQGIKVAGGYGAMNVPPVTSANFPNLVYETEEAEHWPKGLDPSDYSPERAVKRAADSGATGAPS